MSYRASQVFGQDLDRVKFAMNAAGIGVWEVDVRNNQIIWDHRCSELIGLPGKHILPYEETFQFIHPDDADAVRTAVDAAFRGVNNGLFDARYRTLGADNVLRWVNFTGTAYFDPEGKVARFGGVARDITTQVTAQLQMQESEAFTNLLSNSVPAMIFYMDTEARYVSYNETFMRWYKVGPTEAVGMFTRDLMGEAAFERIRPRLERALAGERVEFEMPAPPRINPEGWLGIVYTPHRAADGSVRGVIAHATDITRSKRAELALEGEVQLRTEELQATNEELQATNEELHESNQNLVHSNEELSQYAYIASHDLQEPLRKIRFFSERVASSGELSPANSSLVGRIIASAERMTTLIQALLEFSRLQRTEVEQARPVDLNAVVKAVVTDFELVIAEKDATMTVGTLPTVEAVGLQMNQLFYNLVGNALKFTKADAIPHVTIQGRSITHDQAAEHIQKPVPGLQYYHLTLADNGIGFDQSFAEQIFEVFKRLHSKGIYPGSGIGLALCRRIVRNHGGAMYAIGEPGKGAAFHIILPGKRTGKGLQPWPDED